MVMGTSSIGRRSVAILAGALAGFIAELLAVIAAIVSGGAGHGSYVAARVLFPFSFLLTVVEGAIGAIGVGLGLLQYPLYGAFLGLAVASDRFRIPIALLAFHVITVIACFSGLLADFT
jgi:hypothetical protein